MCVRAINSGLRTKLHGWAGDLEGNRIGDFLRVVRRRGSAFIPEPGDLPSGEQCISVPDGVLRTFPNTAL